MSAFKTDLPGAHTWYLLRGKSRSPEASVIPLNISILHPYQTGAQKQSEMFTENSWSTASHQRRKQSRLLCACMSTPNTTKSLAVALFMGWGVWTTLGERIGIYQEQSPALSKNWKYGVFLLGSGGKVGEKSILKTGPSFWWAVEREWSGCFGSGGEWGENKWKWSRWSPRTNLSLELS